MIADAIRRLIAANERYATAIGTLRRGIQSALVQLRQGRPADATTTLTVAYQDSLQHLDTTRS